MKPTPITAEIIRLREVKDSYNDDELNGHIYILIGLLPAEKEALINAWSRGREIGSIYESEQWFSQTYTQDYKTK